MVAAIVVVLGRVVLRHATLTQGRHDDEVDGPRAASTCQDEAVELII
jgi:hypothetical protein